MNYIILIIAGIVGIAIGRYLGKRRGTLLLRRSADSEGQVPKDFKMTERSQEKEKEEKQEIN